MSNKCTCCGTPLQNGVEVCGHCLRKNDGPAFHQAVRVLNRYCIDYRRAHENCDKCPLKHHCQNTISTWPKLMLVTDMADYEEVELPRVQKAVKVKKSKLLSWVHNNFFGIYIGIAVIFGSIIFALGWLVGQAC